MRALLIYPEFPDTFWSFKHALGFIRKKASAPPLGLLTVAAMLPEEWDLRLVDANVTKLKEKDLTWADLILISAMTVQRASTLEIIARCRKAGKRIVAGGPLFTAEPEQFAMVDHLVLNEAEITLPPFLVDLENGRAKRIYATSAFADLRQTPVPRWDLADLKAYASMSVQYSRGCPFNCEFCNVTALLGHEPRTKSARQILAELDGLYDLGWRGNIFFVDDNFIGNKRKLKAELLPALIDWRKGKRGLSFNTEASINLADDDELMRMMVAAGFDTVFVGIETTDQDSLAECGKQQNLRRDLVADAKRIQRAGLQVQGGFIVGFDHDAPDVIKRLTEFIQKSGIVTAMVGLLQALPGTKLHERMGRAGRLLPQNTGDNVDGTTNIVPLGNPEALRRGYMELLRHLYSPKVYYQRVRTFLREYKLPRIKIRLDLAFLIQQGMAFIRSLFRLGVVGKERVHYWKLLWWTLIRRPRAFPLAVSLAIYGYHFRRICELHVR